MMLGVLIIKDYEKYLGLPSLVGRQKKACFNKVKERIWAKMQGWKEKLLSQAGKRGGDQSCGPIDPYIFHECVSLTCWTSKRY